MGSRKERDSSIVGSSSELVTAPVRAGQALEETTALMSSVTRDGGSQGPGLVREGSGLCQGSQLESSGVATSSSSGHQSEKLSRDGYRLAGRMEKIRILAFVVKT